MPRQNLTHRAFTSREKNRQVRAAIIRALGSQCVKCSFSDSRALQVDHVNGGGRLDKNRGYALYRKIVKSQALGTNEYQLLCANCNMIKAVETGELSKSKGSNYIHSI